MKRIGSLGLSNVISFFLTLAAASAESTKLKVLTSFLPIYCFTVNVAGEWAEVENLLPANVEPHDYQLSRKDLQKINSADLIVINGLGLETWLDKVLRDPALTKSKTILEAGAGLERQLIFGTRQFDLAMANPSARFGRNTRLETREFPNPHVWLDPHLAGHCVTNILSALQKADPVHATGYAANAAHFTAQLEKLDADIGRTLSPYQHASIITYHEAFAYFARRYGLDIVGVIEPVPDVKPSLKYLASLYQTIRKSRIKAIFAEAQSTSKLADQIGRDLRVPVARLDTLESGPLKPAAYEEVMRKNLGVLEKSLKADAPRSSS